MRILLLLTIFLSVNCWSTYLIPDGSIGQSKLSASIAQPGDIMNCSITAGVAASALTVTLKNAAGSTPSASSPCKINFRNATATTGTYAAGTAVASTTVVLSSGSTLGSTGGPSLTEYAYIYAINNAGTVELAISSKSYDSGSIVTTTVEGGAGAADSATAIYSTTARSNVALRVIGRIAFTEAVAGTWATTPSEISSGDKFQTQSQKIEPKAWVVFDSSTGADLTGTYARVGTTVTVTATAHGLVVGNKAFLNFTSGTAVDGGFVVTSVADANTFTVTHGTSGSTSGNVTLERVTVNSSQGISVVSWQSTGIYYINFSPCLPDANYAFFGSAENGAGGSASRIVEILTAEAPHACYIVVDSAIVNTAQNHTLNDGSSYISWMFFR